MPLTDKGEDIKKAMTQQYGAKKGEQVFYASRNKGTITGVDSAGGNEDKLEKIVKCCNDFDNRGQ